MKKTKIPETQIAAITNQARHLQRLRQLKVQDLSAVAGGSLRVDVDCW